MRWKFFLIILLLSFFLVPFFIKEEVFFSEKENFQKSEKKLGFDTSVLLEEKREKEAQEKKEGEKSKEEPKEIFSNHKEEQENVLLEVPFTSQAPFGEWSEPRFQNGCEEASILMAMLWINGRTVTQEEVKKEILRISFFGEEKFGYFEDTSASETVLLMKDFYDYENIELQYEVTVAAIIAELRKGNIVLIPAQGQRLKNPYYTPPGPERHMLVIRGYDERTKEFITNDPGTRRGELYRYSYDILFEAILDYPSGKHEPILLERKAMIVVGK